MTGRPDPPVAADEVTTLLAFLDHYRDTLRRQTEGLPAELLRIRLEPSSLTLGSLLKHLAFVEGFWFRHVLAGEEQHEPWASMDWEADRDADFTSAAEDSPEQLRGLFDREVAEADERIRSALAEGGLDRLSARPRRGRPVSLRWILVHMIEEYARHCGHADLIRESIDGAVDL
ncbi:DinB family protein [Nocardioides coralli]|uniref:DinB family protein n=1 Tax=Nocardioides coralli TaxID=2872154 RepID=UPI002016EE20|nr:DinB family protein [Nocardioides coralli]